MAAHLGAVQNAELALSAGRGNAFDIASLTIALLRAPGHPRPLRPR